MDWPRVVTLVANSAADVSVIMRVMVSSPYPAEVGLNR
jgi:hypothetical protein